MSLLPRWPALPQDCHSEERSDEESGAGVLRVSLDPPPQTSRRARGDMLGRFLRHGLACCD